jgi:squalene synthase HpnC
MADLAELGPDASPAAPWPLDQARDYCRRLARSHYENFHVASWLLPRRLRPHFYAVYAYCRWADDLADETGEVARGLALLEWWREQLDECFAGRARHPVFVALAETARQCGVPRQPFADLLDAFRQDQTVTRYETITDVLDYCRRSADPVGRIVLYLGGAHDERRAALADQICTGLQLANFCQDVAADWDRGRVYLPLDACRRFDFSEADFARRTTNASFRRLLAWYVDEAEARLRAGLPLVDLLPGRLRGDVWLFAHGGLKILAKIREIDFDVWSARPRVSRFDRGKLLAGCLWRMFFFPRGSAV